MRIHKWEEGSQVSAQHRSWIMAHYLVVNWDRRAYGTGGNSKAYGAAFCLIGGSRFM